MGDTQVAVAQVQMAAWPRRCPQAPFCRGTGFCLKVQGGKQQRVLSHSPLGHTETTCRSPRPHCPYGGCSEHREGKTPHFPRPGCWVPNQALWLRAQRLTSGNLGGK